MCYTAGPCAMETSVILGPGNSTSTVSVRQCEGGADMLPPATFVSGISYSARTHQTTWESQDLSRKKPRRAGPP